MFVCKLYALIRIYVDYNMHLNVVISKNITQC